MSLEVIRHDNMSYFYYSDRVHAYYYDEDDCINVIIYKCKDFAGNEYKAEWHIFGPRDAAFTKRMVKKMEPWDVVRIGPSRYLGERLEAVY